MSADYNSILPEIQQGLNAKFKVSYRDEFGEQQEVTTSLGQCFVPPDATKIKRDIVKSRQQPKKSRRFWEL